jgi:DNA-binding transcriptional MerR regulator
VSDIRSYLSIGEVLALLQQEFPDATISKIRFLESQGLIDPERTASGYRKFYDDDVERLRFILREQKDHFLPLKVIKGKLADAEPDMTSHHPSGRLPAWMTVGRPDPAPEIVQPPSTRPTRTSTPAPQSEASFTFDELAQAAGLAKSDLQELERFGLVSGRRVGQTSFYDESALVIARVAAAFVDHGIEARHLKMFRTMVEREASLYEQVILPFLKQRNPNARARANTILAELANLGDRLRSALLTAQLENYQ